jgi:hypothetical protein
MILLTHPLTIAAVRERVLAGGSSYLPALRRWAKAERDKAKKDRRKKGDKEADRAAEKAAAKLRGALLELVTENGKPFKELSYEDLVVLENKNANRATLYCTVRSKMKPGQIVKEALTDAQFWSIYQRVAEIELAGLFQV